MRLGIRIPLLLLSVLFFLPLAHGQKKGKIDPKDVTIDSLMQVNQGLESLIDSIASETVRLGQEASKYQELYKVIRDKLVKREFKPAELGVLLDGYMADQADKYKQVQQAANEYKTRVEILETDNVRLQQALESAQSAVNDKDQIITELKQLKELLDAKIITQAEYDAKKVKLLEKW